MEDIRQLAGYARDRKVLKRLGIQEVEEQDSAVVPCVIIYPESRDVDVKFDGSHSPIEQVRLEVAPIGALIGFYRIGFPLPVLSAGGAEGLWRGTRRELFCVGRGRDEEDGRAGASSNDGII